MRPASPRNSLRRDIFQAIAITCASRESYEKRSVSRAAHVDCPRGNRCAGFPGAVAASSATAEYIQNFHGPRHTKPEDKMGGQVTRSAEIGVKAKFAVHGPKQHERR